MLFPGGVPLSGTMPKALSSSHRRRGEGKYAPVSLHARDRSGAWGKDMGHFVSPMRQVALVPHAQQEALWPHPPLSPQEGCLGQVPVGCLSLSVSWWGEQGRQRGQDSTGNLTACLYCKGEPVVNFR